MSVIQQATGQFNGNAPFTVALPAASSAANTVIVVIAGNAAIATPTGFTLRTSQVNWMGHYLWDRAGGGTSYSFTANGQGIWWMAEVTGAYDTAQSANNTATGTTYTSPSITPAAGTRTLIGSLGSIQPGTPRTVTFSAGWTEQFDGFVTAGDYPSHALAVRESPGGTAYTFTGTFSAGTGGRSAIIASYVSGDAGTALSWTANFAGAGSLSATSNPALVKAGALSGSGALVGALKPGFAKSAALAGAGSLTVTLTPSTTAQGMLTGTGALAGALAPNTQITATLNGTGQLTATLAGTTQHQWTATLQGEGALTATLTKGITIHHVFNGNGDQTATLAPTLTISATLTGTGTLTDAQEPNMAQPSPDWGLVLLKWAGTYLDGTPCAGRLKLAFTGGIRQDADIETPLSIYPAPFSVQLTTKTVLFSGTPRTVGYAELWVPATDDPDITGTGDAYYTLTEELNAGGGRTAVKFLAPVAAPIDGIWLNTLESL